MNDLSTMGLKEFMPQLEQFGDDSGVTDTPDTLQENVSNLTTQGSPTTELPAPGIQSLACQFILFQKIPGSLIRIWDIIILVPNAVFLIFLIGGAYSSVQKLKSTQSPIIKAFYGLVWMVAAVGVIRAVVSMLITEGNIADKILWLVLRFLLLATELSVVIFGVGFGHLDSRRSIPWVLLFTTIIASAYSITQAVLEFIQPDPHFHHDAHSKNYDIFGHGGMLFWFSSSLFFFIIYSVIVILPYTRLKETLSLPTKRSFYVYVSILAILNLAQAIGSILLYKDVIKGMCVVDVTTCLYFTCFAPLVYGTFLREFLRFKPTNISFSYKSHVDETAEDDDEDNVSLPHQTDASGRTDLTTASYDSTQFTATSPELYENSENPLYNSSINVVDNDFASGQSEIS